MPLPTITTFTPTAGPTAGGTTVTITGTNFTGATCRQVRHNNRHISFTVTGATTIKAKTKAHVAATVTIKITTPGGTVTSTAKVQFQRPAHPHQLHPHRRSHRRGHLR